MRQQLVEADSFGLPLEGAVAVAERHAEMQAADTAAMFIALAQFCNSMYPDRLDYLDRVFAACAQASLPKALMGCVTLTKLVFWVLHVLTCAIVR